MSQKIITVEVLVPFKQSGGIIRQHQVAFDVYKYEDYFGLRPCLSERERQVANLPDELKFTVQNGHPVSLRGKMDGNLHIIRDVVAVLKEQKVPMD